MADRRALSVVVPAHNAASYLDRTLTAIAASTLPRSDWELIVVDDASTDGTEEVARRYADSVVRTGDLPHGPGFARNRGVDAATGDVIAFIDADVIVKPEALGLLLGRLTDQPDRVAVFGAYDDEPDHSSAVSVYRNLLHHYTHVQTAGNVATFWAGCGAVKARAFRSVGGFDEVKYPRPQIEDIELGYRLNSLGQIYLDPAIQGKHLKRWSVGTMMRTDFNDRAVPWVRLLLATRGNRSASNPSLGLSALASTFFAPLSLLFVLAAMVLRQPVLFLGAAACAATVVVLNIRFYSWLASRSGVAVALTAIPLHFAYQLLSAAAVPVGVLKFMAFDRGNEARSVKGVTGGRFIPLASGEIGARLVAFVATAYLARTLGASAFGQIAFAMALVSHFGIALSVGIGEVGAREVARDPEHASRHAADGVTLRLILAAFALSAIFLIAALLHLDPQKRLVTWLYALSVIPLALDTSWVYKGLGRTARVGKALVLDQLVGLVLILAAVSSASHVTRVPVIQLIGDMSAALFLGIPLIRGEWSFPRADVLRSLARKSTLITGSRILRTIVVSFDTVLLGLMVASREVGWYSAAYRLVFFVMAILYSSHVAFLPEIARSVNAPAALGAIMSRSIGLALAVTTPFVVGGILLASQVMNLVFGLDYQHGALALQILLGSLVLLAIHAATRNVFLALHRLGLEAAIIAAGVVVNVVLNFILIPRQGIEGAAIATLAGEGVILAGALAALAALGVRASLRDSAPALFSGIILGIAIRVIPATVPVLATILLGGIVYVVAIAGSTVLLRRSRVELADSV